VTARALLVAALLAVTLGGAANRADAERTAAAAPAAGPPPAGALYAPAPGLAGLPATDVDLALVRVDSTAHRTANRAYQDVAVGLAAAQRTHVEADRTLSQLAERAERVTAEVAGAGGRRQASAARLDQIVSSIQELAIDAYMSGGETTELALALDVRPALEPEQRRVLGSASLETLIVERGNALADLAAADLQARRAVAEQSAIARVMATTAAAKQRALEAEAARGAELIPTRVALEDARVLARVSGADFPLVAMDAYYKAAQLANDDDPACAVQWWGIAGISKVEGRHGSYGGSALDRVGNATPKIIGIQLNGSNNTRVIGDSEGGALDGDPMFDRAIGPMQFIPTTWRMVRSDGNRDGVEDPHNMYDATLAAGTYLCRAANGLADDPGLRSAYFSYNHSEAYVANVLGWARGYQRIEIPPI
jgi:membrane-bound lytic murein transglycosylase B